MDILLAVLEAVWSVFIHSVFLWVLIGWPFEKADQQVEVEETEPKLLPFRRAA
jgi:hypothetical protein